MDAEKLFLNHLDLIDQVIRFVCRRHCVGAEGVEDFESFVKLRFVSDDYRILRSFQGRSSLKTYLVTVVHRLFLDYRIAQWGKWRPSAGARRMGEAGISLETLIYRDGHSVDEAVEILRTNQGVRLTEEQLREMASRLPVRTSHRMEGEEALQQVAVTARQEEAVEVLDHAKKLAEAEKALSAAMARLTSEDRLILKMRFEDQFTVAQIAQVLRVEQKPLYRRFEQLLRRLRSKLEDDGVRYELLSHMMETPAWDFRVDFSKQEREFSD